MNKFASKRPFALILAIFGYAPGMLCAQLGEISNFREYSETFSSSGQPTIEQLTAVRDAGFERVIYIAFSTDGNAIAQEDKIVSDLGMDYVQIPVVWNRPTLANFNLFSSILRQEPDAKTLLHCQVNFRASAFSFLHRVINEGVSVADAKADMNSVWQPNETWRDFIFSVLAENGISPDCSSCNWDVSQ
jgi:protein tyrosine phosphatase (PTP) superfamily phosphohydrolase (DUF442 family)